MPVVFEKKSVLMGLNFGHHGFTSATSRCNYFLKGPHASHIHYTVMEAPQNTLMRHLTAKSESQEPKCSHRIGEDRQNLKRKK